MDVGKALLERARAGGHTGIAVVGTGKNVGKTVTTVAVYEVLCREGVVVGLTSIGRDGEERDVVEATAKPRLFLHAGTLIATAQSTLSPYPAVEIIQHMKYRSALGPIVLARIRVPGFYEIAGPAGADALQSVMRALRACGAAFTLLDGAVDRIAALREGEDAIVVATGAASDTVPARVVEEVKGLVGKLSLRSADTLRPILRVPGALHAGEAALLAQNGERRQILVRDATRIAFGGTLFLGLAAQLDFRCERTLYPIATTVASMSSKRFFEPVSFLQAVAKATGLPAYDVYAQATA
jgi:hypothetical protein